MAGLLMRKTEMRERQGEDPVPLHQEPGIPPPFLGDGHPVVGLVDEEAAAREFVEGLRDRRWIDPEAGCDPARLHFSSRLVDVLEVLRLPRGELETFLRLHGRAFRGCEEKCWHIPKFIPAQIRRFGGSGASEIKNCPSGFSGLRPPDVGEFLRESGIQPGRRQIHLSGSSRGSV